MLPEPLNTVCKVREVPIQVVAIVNCSYALQNNRGMQCHQSGFPNCLSGGRYVPLRLSKLPNFLERPHPRVKRFLGLSAILADLSLLSMLNYKPYTSCTSCEQRELHNLLTGASKKTCYLISRTFFAE